MMSKTRVELLENALTREKLARKAAEKILEKKSLELYELSEEVKKTNQVLENLVVKKELELKGVFKNIIDPYCVIDFSGNIIEMNDATLNLLGCSNKNEELNVNDFLIINENEKIIEKFVEVRTTGQLQNFKVKIKSRNHQIKELNINASLIFNEKKEPVAVQGIARDITKENEAKKRLIESENRLKDLILNLDNGIFLEDENRKVILVNEKLCDLFYMTDSPESYIGQDMSNGAEEMKQLFKNPDKFVYRYKEIIARREIVKAEEVHLVDGKILERNYLPIYKNGEFKGHLWSFNDVTLKRKFNQNLEMQKQKYSNIIANMHLGLIEVNNEDEILLVNQSFEEMSGYSEKELIGQQIINFFPMKPQAKIVVGEYNSYEINLKTKTKKESFWLVGSAPNYNVNGQIIGSICVCLDITSLKTLEKQKEVLLKELEKSNDELQEYAHIVSHDLKSPLRSVYALVNWLKEDNLDKLDANSIENISLIESTLEKMEALISDILNYSSLSIEKEEQKEVDLNVVVDNIEQILLIPEHINLFRQNKLPVLRGDKTKFQQLFQNLISNAIKFIDKKEGVVTLNVEDKGSFYQFSVQDNGIGIEKKYHNKIFKIFNSLNKSKDSTGIGLSIVKKIVDLYKGEIWLKSKPNVGTTFYFTLRK
ncbi:PAS domain S-box protein [Polaribacter huanghezhanensis]|uniref:PAS domain S-box protein n=1 Tax=Polaribacter huanghezhanensis TaxID=1354726 RepID=UPI003455C0EE